MIIILQILLFFICIINVLSGPIKWVNDDSHKYLSYVDEDELSKMMETYIVNNTNIHIPCASKKNGNFAIDKNSWIHMKNNNIENVNVEVSITLFGSINDFLRNYDIVNQYKKYQLYKKAGRLIYNKKNLGKSICDSGLLVIIFIEDAKMVIARGDSITIFNSFTNNLLTKETLSPIFRQYRIKKDYNNGIKAIITKIHNILDIDLNDNIIIESNWNIVCVVLALIVCIVISTIVYMISIFFACSVAIPEKYTPTFDQRENKYKKVFDFARKIKTNAELAKETHDKTCCICFEQMAFGENDKEVIITRCKHVFHTECIHSWINIHPSCPLCRKKISIKSLKTTQRNSNKINTENVNNVFYFVIDDNPGDEYYIYNNIYNQFPEFERESYGPCLESTNYSSNNNDALGSFIDTFVSSIGSGGWCDNDIDVGDC